MSKNKKSKTTYKSTEQLEKNLASYYRRIDQLKTIQIARQAELDLIRNDPQAWLATQNIGKRTNVKNFIENKKKELATKVTRLDILLMKAEGGKITQAMFDYGGDLGIFRKQGKNFIETFNLVKPDGDPYVVGDDYIPTDKDRFTLIENIEELIDDREFAQELRNTDDTPSKDFPRITVQDPNNKYKKITIDNE